MLKALPIYLQLCILSPNKMNFLKIMFADGRKSFKKEFFFSYKKFFRNYYFMADTSGTSYFITKYNRFLKN